MYREMEEAGLPEPEYKTVAFMVHATIKNKKYIVDVASAIACDLLGVKERRARSVLVDRDCRKRRSMFLLTVKVLDLSFYTSVQ